jgi:hypothetical protein
MSDDTITFALNNYHGDTEKLAQSLAVSAERCEKAATMEIYNKRMARLYGEAAGYREAARRIRAMLDSWQFGGECG